MVERKNRTRKPNHPGQILNELYLKPLKLSVSNLANRLHISRKTLSKIINMRGSITPEMAFRLSRAFSTTPQLWLNLQRDYDLWCVEQEKKDWKLVEPLSEVVDSVTIS